jgi:hypothetical protein
MTFDVRVWWTGLCAIALVNVVLWSSAARSFARGAPADSAAVRGERRMHLALSFVYVVVCAFRSFLPRADVQRICLVDSFYSSVFVGRSVATVAELCFAMQWALFLRQLSNATGLGSVRVISRALVPMIVWAEICSWYAVLSTNYLGNVLEQSTWTLGGMLILTAYLRAWPHAHEGLSSYLRRTVGVILVFITFMCLVDIPHYLAHWHEDQLAGKVYLHWREGLRDSAQRWVIEYAWDAWRDEVAWMSLYFSVGVWISIAFSRARVEIPRTVPDALPISHAT